MPYYELSFNCERDIDDCWSEEYRDRIESDLLWVLGAYGDSVEVDRVADAGGRDDILVRFDSAEPLRSSDVAHRLNDYGYGDLKDFVMDKELE